MGKVKRKVDKRTAEATKPDASKRPDNTKTKVKSEVADDKDAAWDDLSVLYGDESLHDIFVKHEVDGETSETNTSEQQYDENVANINNCILDRRKKIQQEKDLIMYVQEHSILFDMSNEFYSDPRMKDKVWEHIGAKLDMSVKVCKKRWKNIRDTYRRYLKEQYKGKEYKFSHMLTFLDPHMYDINVVNENSSEDKPEPPPTTTSAELEIKIDAPPEDTLPTRPASAPKKRPAVNDLSETIMNYLNEKEARRKVKREEDEGLRLFFMSLYNTVRDFPPILQAKAKKELFRVVTDAEITFLEVQQSSCL